MDSSLHEPRDRLVVKGPLDRADSDAVFQSRADPIGYWFAAAVVVAFLWAGLIVYRTGNQEIRTASNEPPLAAQTDPLQPPAILPAREPVTVR